LLKENPELSISVYPFCTLRLWFPDALIPTVAQLVPSKLDQTRVVTQWATNKESRRVKKKRY
jgi:hypothetical protein